MNTEEMIVGILTGDVVTSSHFSQDLRVRLPDILRGVWQQVSSAFESAVPYSIDVFRGDSWQLVVVEPEKTLRIALDMRCRLHALEPSEPILTRIGIGIGGVDFIPESDVSEGDGPAYRLSGQALETLDRYRHLDIRIADAHTRPEYNGLPVIATLIDAIANRWTPKQSLAVSGALRGRTQEQIGASWSPNTISQQAVAQHLESAGWNAISSGVDYFERAVGALSNPSSTAPAADEGSGL